MVICSCRAVSDRVVRAAIAQGATTVEDLSDRCAAASGCGGCRSELERLIEVHAAECVARPDRADRVAAA